MRSHQTGGDRSHQTAATRWAEPESAIDFHPAAAGEAGKHIYLHSRNGDTKSLQKTTSQLRHAPKNQNLAHRKIHRDRIDIYRIAL
jgi:hypothetical protein